MRDISVHDEVRSSATRNAELHAVVQPLRTLGDVLTWSRTATRSRQPATALKDGERVLGYAACVVSAEHRGRFDEGR